MANEQTVHAAQIGRELDVEVLSDKSRGRRPTQQGEMDRREERFLSAQADPFTGVKGEEKVGLLRSE